MDRAEESRFPLTPQRIVNDVRKVMPADGIVALDNGMYKIWFARCYRTRNANTLLLDNALATMGAGLPSAMMAAMLNPGKRVMAVCGDGGFMMNSQELETAVRLKLDLVVLIIQDDAYGMIRWKQAVDNFADWGLTFGNPDFVKYAEAYGAQGPARRVGGVAGFDARSGVRRRRRPAGHRAGRLQRERARARRRTAQQGARGVGMKTRAAVLETMGAAPPYAVSQPLRIDEVDLGAARPGRGTDQDRRRGVVPLRSVGDQRRPPATDADGDRPRGRRRGAGTRAPGSPTWPSAIMSSSSSCPAAATAHPAPRAGRRCANRARQPTAPARCCPVRGVSAHDGAALQSPPRLLGVRRVRHRVAPLGGQDRPRRAAR